MHLNSPKRNGKTTGGNENLRESRPSKHSGISEIGQNTQNCPPDLRIIILTLTPLKVYNLNLLGKTRLEQNTTTTWSVTWSTTERSLAWNSPVRSRWPPSTKRNSFFPISADEFSLVDGGRRERTSEFHAKLRLKKRNRAIGEEIADASRRAP